MSEMDSGGTTRRDMLKKTAVAGAIVWSVPTLTASPAFAAGSLSTNLCPGEVTSVTYKWNARETTFSVCTESGPGQPTNGSVGATGDSTGWTHALITADRLTGSGSVHSALPVNGSTSGALVAFNGQFTTTGSLPPNTRFTLKQADAAGNLLGGEQTMTYHFSCSQPLCFGDKHGPLEVVSYTVA